MNTLQNETPQTPKATVAVIDVGLQAQGYAAWLKERTHGRIDVTGRGGTIEQAAALLKQKPDCVIYNPWSLAIADPAQALVTRDWGDYTGACYGVAFLETIQQVSPNSKVLICTEDIDREFVMEHGKRFENFSGYLHSWNMDVAAVVARVMQGDIIASKAPSYYYPNLKDTESFEALCEQTDLLALAEHQRRSPKHIYYSVLVTMECMKVQSFAECKDYVSGMDAPVTTQ